MSRYRLVDAYVNELQRRLGPRGMDADGTLREIRAHLIESARRAERAGVLRTEAERQAIASFGSTELIADLLAPELVPTRARRAVERWGVALAAVAATLALTAIAAGLAVDGQVFGILSSDRRPVRSASGAIVYRPPLSTLVRVDPRTLRPLSGRRVKLGTALMGYVSPNRTRFATAMSGRAGLRFVDLNNMRIAGDVVLARGRDAQVRALGWVRDDRLLAVMQGMGGPNDRQVLARSLIGVDPISQRVLWRRSLARTALRENAVAGGRFVFLQGDSNHRSPSVRISVAEGNGSLRSADFRVGTVARRGARRWTALAVEPSGERAFLATSGSVLTEIDLDTMRATRRTVRLVGGVPSRKPTAWSLRLSSAGANALVATGFPAPRRNGRLVPLGVTLIDTKDWTARVVDARASSFLYVEGTLLTYGGFAARARRGQGGAGVNAYDLDGRRRYTLFPNQAIASVQVVGGYVHIRRSPLVFRESRPRSVFELRSGRNLGRIARPPTNLFIVGSERNS